MQMPAHALRAATLAVVALCFACSEPDSRLRLRVDRVQLSASDSVRLSMVFVNRTSRTVRTPAADSYGMCSHPFQVFDSQDRPVAVLEGFCIAALIAVQMIDLAPGQSITIVDYWHPGSSTLNGKPLPAGFYRIIGRVFFDNESVTTSPVVLQVTP